MSAPLVPHPTLGNMTGEGDLVGDRPRAELHLRGLLFAGALGALMWALLFLAARWVARAV
jgi:hypothetical protein